MKNSFRKRDVFELMKQAGMLKEISQLEDLKVDQMTLSWLNDKAQSVIEMDRQHRRDKALGIDTEGI